MYGRETALWGSNNCSDDVMINKSIHTNSHHTWQVSLLLTFETFNSLLPKSEIIELKEYS